jgi:hypothetical protein
MVPEPGPDDLVRDVPATNFVEYWALFPRDFEHDFQCSKFNPRQTMMTWFALPGDNELDILLF